MCLGVYFALVPGKLVGRNENGPLFFSFWRAGCAKLSQKTDAAMSAYQRKLVKGSGAVPALKTEMLKVQKSYGNDFITITSAKKSDPRFPWPLNVTRIIERPAEYDMWDVDELHLRLGVDRVTAPDGSGKFLVPVAELINHGNSLPPELVDIISAAVQQKWESLLRKRDATPRKNAQSWALERVFDWADTQYGKFLRLVPSLIESYLGTSIRGDSQRRYLISAVTEVQAVVEELTEEEREERRKQAIANFIASQTRKMERELQAEREKERAGQLRR